MPNGVFVPIIRWRLTTDYILKCLLINIKRFVYLTRFTLTNFRALQ